MGFLAFLLALKRRCWGRQTLSPMSATTRGSPLTVHDDDRRARPSSSAATSLSGNATLNGSSGIRDPKTLEHSERGSDGRLTPEPPLAKTPTNSCRHFLVDGALPVDELEAKLWKIAAQPQGSLKQPTRQQQPFARRLACHPRLNADSDTHNGCLKGQDFRVHQIALLVCGLLQNLSPALPYIGWDLDFIAKFGLDKYTEHVLGIIDALTENCLDLCNYDLFVELANSRLKGYKTLEEDFAQRSTPEDMTIMRALGRLQRYQEAWSDLAQWPKELFDKALSFYLAKCLGTLGIAASLDAIQEDQLRVIMNLSWEFETRHIQQPVGLLLADYGGPLGKQTDIDLEDETGTDGNIDNDTDEDDINDDIDGDETDTDGDLGDNNGHGRPYPSLLEDLFSDHA